MSIYMGTSNSGNKILHMTDTLVSSDDIKSDTALPSTIFHSSLPYLQLFASYDVPVIRTLTFAGSSGSMYSFTAPIPNDAIDLALAGYKFIVVLSTTNTGGRRVIVDASSRFSVRSGNYPFAYGTLTYAWGPTANAYSWQENPSSVPSYTNKYILLSDFGNYTDPFLYPSTGSGHSYPLDNVIGNTATVYFFNIKHNDLEVINSPKSIYIDNSTFLIGTPYGYTDLATFKPFRLTSSPTATSFSTIGSNINIQPYVHPTSPLSSWIIDGTNSNAGSITKKLADGSIENFISGTSKNMILVDSLTKTYNVTAPNNGSTSVGLGVPVSNNEAVTVIVSGTFSNPVTTRTIGGHTNFLTNNSVLETVAQGKTTLLNNGTYRMNEYRLQAGVVNGALTIRAIGIQTNAPTGYAGTFTGTVRILKFKIS